ncbi:MAG TPA: hypothetical protein VJP85_04335 [Candidatus Baltobacteraceae bacterium]|nr:hypothetical protein [Candidatus Baltobacteraceae bacterium]
MIADPYAIFAAAQQHWQAEVYPKHLSYGIAVTVTRRGVTSQAHYHVRYDTADSRVTLAAVSDEELAHPYTPHGINFFYNISFYGGGGGIPGSSPQHTFDYLGVPELAPNYAFGIVPSGAPPNTQLRGMDLVREIRREFHDPLPPQRVRADSGNLKTIAIVIVAHRQYDIRLVGAEPLLGHIDYHLALKAVSDPAVYRLREMWVDASTYATDRVVTDGNFTAAGLTGVRWRTDFAQISGATFITTESALAGFTTDRRSYDSATVAFTGMTSMPTNAAFPMLHGFATDAQTAPAVLSEPLKPRV